MDLPTVVRRVARADLKIDVDLIGGGIFEIGQGAFVIIGQGLVRRKSKKLP